MNWRLSLLLLLVAMRVSAATLYVSVAGSGAANGADWSNTLSESFTPVRGNTYYYADGSYASKTFSTALSSTSLIVLQKATVADHGTSTGWSDTMGDGQATFAYPLTFSTGYWTMDGATGTNLTTCGFVISPPTSCSTATQHYIGMGTGSTALDNMTFAHIASLACSDDVEKLFFYFGTQVTANNFTARYIYADGFQGTFFLWGVSNVLTEYVTITNAFSSASHHGEQWNMRYGSSRSCRDVTIRYCTITDSVGTGCIIANDGGSDEIVCLGLNVYGNVFRGGSGGNGIIGATTRSAYANANIFNNTFSGASTPWIVAAQSGSSATIKNATTNIVATNNIIFNMSAALGDYATAPIVHDYNLFVSATSIPSEANGVTTSSNPFISSAGFNFRLTGATTAGATLASTFNTDPDGVTRGADGTWDRGAYEYGGGDVTAPTCVISSPTNNQPSVATSVSMTGTSSDDTAVSSVTLTNLSTATGFTVTGTTSWSATATLAYGSNYIRAIATDSSGNKATNAIAVWSVNNTNTWSRERNPYLGMQYLQVQNPASQHALASNTPATYVNMPITYAILTGGAYGGYGNGTNYYDATYALNTNAGFQIILQFSDMPTNKILDYLPYLTNRYHCWMVIPINENDDATVSSETIKYYRAVMPNMRLGGPALYHLKNPTYIDALVASGAFAMLDSFVGHDYLAVPLNGNCTAGWWTNSYYHPIEVPTDYHPEWSVGNLAARLAWMNTYTNLLRTNYTDTPKVMVTEYGIYQNNPEDGLYAGQIFRNMQIPVWVTANFATTNACPYNNALYDGVGVGYFTPSQQNFLKRIAPLSRGLGTVTTDKLVIQ